MWLFRMISRSSFLFFAEGTPVPQGSKRAFLRGGRISIVEANPKTREFRSVVSLACKRMMLEVESAGGFDGPFAVELVFVFPKPKTVKRVWHTVKPDVDKLSRLVLDSISDAGFWLGDQQVVSLSARKRYAEFEGEPSGVWVQLRHAETES